MLITIDAVDDLYFFLADKTESFWCKYHMEWTEFLFVNRLKDWTVTLYNPETNNLLEVASAFFEEQFNIVGHPVHIWRMIDLMDARVVSLYETVKDEIFAKYVFLARQITWAWTHKWNPIESACISQELFDNLIKLIWEFFDDPRPSEYKRLETSAEDESKAIKDLLNPSPTEKWTKKSKKNSK